MQVYLEVRRHVGGGGIKIVLLQVSDYLRELVLTCFLSFSLVGLKAVRGRWWEQDRTAIVKGE